MSVVWMESRIVGWGIFGGVMKSSFHQKLSIFFAAIEVIDLEGAKFH